MNLCASLIVRNEAERYLRPCIQHLQDFCDTIRVLDDGSDDGTFEILADMGIEVRLNDGPSFFQHEGQARQKLLNWTLLAKPDFVLAIDADEFISDGRALRARLDKNIAVQRICMMEVWGYDASGITIRTDGGWAPHPVPILWTVPQQLDSRWRIQNRALACGREPIAVRSLSGRFCGVDILHFGWAREEERQARYERYAVHDGGKFHRNAHIESIMFPDERTRRCRARWPAGLAEILT